MRISRTITRGIQSSLACSSFLGSCKSIQNQKCFAERVAELTGCRVALNVLYCHKVNRDKANGKYDQYTGYADDRDPDFVMVL
jgi:hypothetical protein